MPIKCFFIDNNIGKILPDQYDENFDKNELIKFA